MKKIFLISSFVICNGYLSFSQNVGIGTSTPAFKLDVRNGSINTDSVYRIGSFPVLATPGNGNLFVGRQAGILNTSGSSNSFFGTNAGHSNTSGYSNIAIGASALFNNTFGRGAVAIGDSALFSINNGISNTAIGSKALFSQVSPGERNTAVGFEALTSNTTGSSNVAVGYVALSENTTGMGNVAIGDFAFKHGTGDGNVAIGLNSMDGASGNVNVAVGSGTSLSSGSNCTVVGSSASVGGNYSYAAAIGSFASVFCSNCLLLGGTNQAYTNVGIGVQIPLTDLHIIQHTDASGDKVRGIRLQRLINGNHWRTMIDPANNYIFEYNDALFSYVEPVGGTFVSPSDERLKKDITPLANVLDKLLLLQPKTYHYIATSDANRLSYGFVAQDVEKLFPEFVFSGEGGIKGIAYSNFSVIAVKAIQEQQKVIEEQKQQLDQQQLIIQDMLKRIELLEKKN